MPGPPPAPVAPRTVPFADQVDGRHLLFATYDAYRGVGPVAYQAEWMNERADGTGRIAGTETVRSRSGAGQFAATVETEAPRHRIRRAVITGGTLLATDYEPDARPAATRQFFRSPLDEGEPLWRSILRAQIALRTKASEMLLTPDWTPPYGALIFLSRTESSATPDAATVVEIDPLTGSEKAPIEVTRRYTIRPATHHLLRYEEWFTPRNAPPAAKGKKTGIQGTYRREDYSAAPGANVLPAGAFSQALPTGYQEQAVPQVSLPEPPPAPKRADPKALSLLHRWREEEARLLSLGVDAQVAMQAPPRTADSDPMQAQRQNVSGEYSLWLQRPGLLRLRADIHGASPRRRAVNVLAVADGAQMRLVDNTTGEMRTAALSSKPNTRFPQRLREAGIPLQDMVLDWLLDTPPGPGQFDQVTLDPADANTILLVRAFHGGQRQTVDATITWRITFGDDGMPRLLVSRRDTNISGLFERDQPPVVTTTTRLTRVSVDTEPPTDAFILPVVPNAKTK